MVGEGVGWCWLRKCVVGGRIGGVREDDSRMTGRGSAGELAARLAEVDPLGDRVHGVFAAVAMGMLAGPTSLVEFSVAVLLVAWLVRIRHTWVVGGAILRDPAFRVGLCALGWVWLSLLVWSEGGVRGGGGVGLEEAGVARFALIPFLIWPVLHHRRWLILGLVVGFLLGNLVQVLHGVGSAFGWEVLTFDRLPGRNSGWWSPVVGGSVLVAALGLHLGAVVYGGGGWKGGRLVGGVLSVVTLVGIAATGTRGAWIASAGLCVVAGVLWVWRTWWVGGRGRGGRKGLVVVGGVGVVVAGLIGLWLVLGSGADRAREGYREVVGALREGEFDSDTGARLLMGWWAVEAWTSSPRSVVVGVGAGGYAGWVTRHLTEQGIDPGTRRVHAHAHNGVLHALATLGFVGAGLWVWFWGLAVWQGRPRFWVVGGGGGAQVGWGYDAGPMLGLVGLGLVSMFDPVQVNQQTAAVLFALAGLCARDRWVASG